MRKPINWINLLCWIAYGILFSMLGIVLISYAETQGWYTVLAMPLIALSFYWLLRKPLFIVAVWLGLTL
jgi:hypothetical protein